MQKKCIKKEEWDNKLKQLLLSYTIFASVENEFGLDYELIRPDDIKNISYNRPKPATSLKTLFLPVKENVTSVITAEKPRIILGIPNCDIEGLTLLDQIYLDRDYSDAFYRRRRENTILIATDCCEILEHCHCTSYNIKPYPTRIADLSLIRFDREIGINVLSVRGEKFLNEIGEINWLEDKDLTGEEEKAHIRTEALLTEQNRDLPGYEKTGILVSLAKTTVWEKNSAGCVSCGACTSVCPTCTCFLLLDKPGFEKVKQMDGCQYPGFERVAGGEDALSELHNRFRNRYMCKYLWRPEKFNSTACTGCGRCIEACIGKINKNEIFTMLENKS